jgi:hypothetical protein
MENSMPPALTPATGRGRLAIVLLALTAMVTGAFLLTGGLAFATKAAQPGDLELTLGPSVARSGPLTQTPTWKATTACPAGYQVSAQLAEFATSGTLLSRISPVQEVGLASPGFTGTLDGTVGALLQYAGASAAHPGTIEWAVGCWNGVSGTGTGKTPVLYEQSTFVTATSAGTYTTSSSSPSPSSSASPSSSVSPSSSPSPSSAAPSSSPSPAPTATSSAPTGGAQTGGGGASLPGSRNGLLIALGAMLLTASAGAAAMAIRRGQALSGNARPDGTGLPGN